MKTVLKLLCLVFLFSFVSIVYIFNNIGKITKDGTYSNNFFEAAKQKIKQENELKLDQKENDHSDVSMEEYLRFYKINEDIHYVCKYILRPHPEDIQWHKNVYQRLEIKFENQATNELFGMKFYFDDRFMFESKQRHIRAFITIGGPGQWISGQDSPDVLNWIRAMNRFTWNVLLWYKKFANPIRVSCKLQGAGGLTRNVSNSFFFQELITCVVPEIDILPQSASIVTHDCAKATTYFEIVYPKADSEARSNEIGVCMSSLFGKFSYKDVPYFVNWMEALRLFGINEVTLNNGSLKFKDNVIKKAFEYYQDIGRLTFTHYPPVHRTWDSPDEDDSASEVVNKITTSDCIYRNLKRYWYVLIIDMDELPVPINFNTYQDYLSYYASKHSNLTQYHCLAIRSSFFYQTQVPGNPEYGHHLPILRLTNKFRTEPIDNGVGLAKSFHNTRNMVSAGHHFTRQTHWGGGPKNIIQQFLPDSDILIHHYRDTCKYIDYCDKHWNDIIHDDIIPRKFGSKLKDNIENVLRNIGYTYLTI